MKLSLGTVQFGNDYGISNSNGRPQLKEIGKILAEAKNLGIAHIDTAPAYNSEIILGELLDFPLKITTKTVQDIENLEEGFHQSLYKLKVKSVHGLLIHNAQIALSRNARSVLQNMESLKKRGLVDKIGISIYEASQIEDILNAGKIDLIQVPMNLLDQRLLENGMLKKLKNLGIEIHVRSVFLQGLLLMDIEKLPGHFRSIRQHLLKIREFLAEKKITILQATIGFINQLKDVDCIVVGVNSKAELTEIASAAQKADSIKDTIQELARFSQWQDEKILNPALWPKT